MASSEEIEAALALAVAELETHLTPTFHKSAATLRSHLSRLREEAAFRDAALKHAAVSQEAHGK